MAAADWVSTGDGGWFNVVTGAYDFSGNIPLEVLQANQVGVTPNTQTPIYYTDPGPVPVPGMTYATNVSSGGVTTPDGTVLQGQYLQPGQAAPEGSVTSTVPEIADTDQPDTIADLIAKGGTAAVLGLGATNFGGLLNQGTNFSGMPFDQYLDPTNFANNLGVPPPPGQPFDQFLDPTNTLNQVNQPFDPLLDPTSTVNNLPPPTGTPTMPPAGTTPTNPGPTPNVPPAGDPSGTPSLPSGLPLSWDDIKKALPGLISAYGSTQQADKLMEIANQSRADRAPYLAKSLEWLNNPQAFYDGPGKSSLDATLRALSAQHGNPIGSPTALALASDVGAKNWMSGVTGFGNLGLAGEDTRAQLQSNAVNTGNIWPALGDSAASVLTPKTSLEQLLKQMKGVGAQFSLA